MSLPHCGKSCGTLTPIHPATAQVPTTMPMKRRRSSWCAKASTPATNGSLLNAACPNNALASALSDLKKNHHHKQIECVWAIFHANVHERLFLPPRRLLNRMIFPVQRKSDAALYPSVSVVSRSVSITNVVSVLPLRLDVARKWEGCSLYRKARTGWKQGFQRLETDTRWQKRCWSGLGRRWKNSGAKSEPLLSSPRPRSVLPQLILACFQHAKLNL